MCFCPQNIKVILYHCRRPTDPTDIFYDPPSFIIPLNVNACCSENTGVADLESPAPFIFSTCFSSMIYHRAFSAGYISPCSADRQCTITESCCSSFVRTTKRLYWHCELTSQGHLQGDPVRLSKVTAEHLRYSQPRTLGMLCGKIKADVTQMRFIHLNKVDHQTDVSAAVLVRQRRKCRKTERGEKQTGKRRGFSAVNTMFFSHHHSSE